MPTTQEEVEAAIMKRRQVVRGADGGPIIVAPKELQHDPHDMEPVSEEEEVDTVDEREPDSSDSEPVTVEDTSSVEEVEDDEEEGTEEVDTPEEPSTNDNKAAWVAYRVATTEGLTEEAAKSLTKAQLVAGECE